MSVPARTPAASGVVVGAGGLHVFIRDGTSLAPAPGQDGVRLHLVREDHHIDVPEDVPPTRGRVRRVRLVRLGHELRAEESAWYPRPGDAVLQEARAAEKWPEDTVEGRRFAGFLVDLDLDLDLEESGAARGS